MSPCNLETHVYIVQGTCRVLPCTRPVECTISQKRIGPSITHARETLNAFLRGVSRAWGIGVLFLSRLVLHSTGRVPDGTRQVSRTMYTFGFLEYRFFFLSNYL